MHNYIAKIRGVIEMGGGELSWKMKVLFIYSETQFNYTCLCPIASISKNNLYKYNHNGNESKI